MTAPAATSNPDLIRLSKAISTTGLYSRRTADQMIKDGRVRVNFDKAITIGTKVVPTDKIFVDDLLLKNDMRIERPKIWMVYKVRGELVANYDMKSRPLIYTRLRKLMETEGNLVPINKLEFNTEGLLLMTNNSLLAKYMESSKSNMDRKYKVRVHGKLTPSKLDGLMRGLRVKGIKYMPIIPTFERTTGVMAWMTVTCKENRKSHLRNCFDHLLLQLPRVISIQFGPYSLPTNFKPGAYVELPLTAEIEKMLAKRL